MRGISNKILQSSLDNGAWISTIEILVGEPDGGRYETLIRRLDRDDEIVQWYRTNDEAVAGHYHWVRVVSQEKNK